MSADGWRVATLDDIGKRFRGIDENHFPYYGTIVAVESKQEYMSNQPDGVSLWAIDALGKRFRLGNGSGTCVEVSRGFGS